VQCSEIGLYNNYITNSAVAGVSIEAANALNINIYGGDIIGCNNYGVNMPLGFCNTISGVGFENGNNTWDILIGNSSGDGCIISGCRSESQNFLGATWGLNTVISCNHNPAAPQLGGYFVWNGLDPCTIINCNTNSSLNWGASGGSALFDITGSIFNLTNFTGGSHGRIRNSYFGGIPGAGTYVYDAFFQGDNLPGVPGGTLNSPGLLSQPNYIAADATTTSPFYRVGLLSDTTNRISMQLDGSDKPVLGFGPGGGSARDTFLNRQGANVFGIGSSFAATDGQITLTIVQTVPVAVASLPPVGTAGRRAFVNNATATTFASIVAGGGANFVPVYDDGTNWRIG
jgi:hypothetical protein